MLGHFPLGGVELHTTSEFLSRWYLISSIDMMKFQLLFLQLGISFPSQIIRLQINHSKNCKEKTNFYELKTGRK